MAKIYSQENLDVYLYEYGYRISTTMFAESLSNSSHMEELPIVFGEPLSVKVI